VYTNANFGNTRDESRKKNSVEQKRGPEAVVLTDALWRGSLNEWWSSKSKTQKSLNRLSDVWKGRYQVTCLSKNNKVIFVKNT